MNNFQAPQTKKIGIVLAILFFFDILKPFGYSLHSELLFIGIIFISLNTKFNTAILFSILFGYFKDSITIDKQPFALIEFPAIVIVVSYFLKNFQKKLAKIFIFFGVILLHIFLCAWQRGAFFPVASLYFFINSSLIFLLLNYLLKNRVHRKSI